MLRRLAEESLPVVEAVGLVTGADDAGGEPIGGVLVTRYLDYSLPFRLPVRHRGGRRRSAAS